MVPLCIKLTPILSPHRTHALFFFSGRSVASVLAATSMRVRGMTYQKRLLAFEDWLSKRTTCSLSSTIQELNIIVVVVVVNRLYEVVVDDPAEGKLKWNPRDYGTVFASFKAAPAPGVVVLMAKAFADEYCLSRSKKVAADSSDGALTGALPTPSGPVSGPVLTCACIKAVADLTDNEEERLRVVACLCPFASDPDHKAVAPTSSFRCPCAQ
jgi:hypothetical protein